MTLRLEIRRVRQLAKAGMPMTKAAQELGCCVDTVKRVARSFNIEFGGSHKRKYDPVKAARELDRLRRLLAPLAPTWRRNT